LAIKSSIVTKLPSMPKGLNDRFMTLKLSLPGKKQATFDSAYAPIKS